MNPEMNRTGKNTAVYFNVLSRDFPGQPEIRGKITQ
jgi:hypothetical protein